MAQFFMHLPKPNEAPGYYDIVTDPISLAEMREKLKGGGYTLSALDADMSLMTSNAHLYNQPDSQVYVDATVLQDVYADARAKL